MDTYDEKQILFAGNKQKNIIFFVELLLRLTYSLANNVLIIHSRTFSRSKIHSSTRSIFWILFIFSLFVSLPVCQLHECFIVYNPQKSAVVRSILSNTLQHFLFILFAFFVKDEGLLDVSHFLAQIFIETFKEIFNDIFFLFSSGPDQFRFSGSGGCFSLILLVI